MQSKNRSPLRGNTDQNSIPMGAEPNRQVYFTRSGSVQTASPPYRQEIVRGAVTVSELSAAQRAQLASQSSSQSASPFRPASSPDFRSLDSTQRTVDLDPGSANGLAGIDGTAPQGHSSPLSASTGQLAGVGSPIYSASSPFGARRQPRQVFKMPKTGAAAAASNNGSGTGMDVMVRPVDPLSKQSLASRLGAPVQAQRRPPTQRSAASQPVLYHPLTEDDEEQLRIFNGSPKAAALHRALHDRTPTTTEKMSKPVMFSTSPNAKPSLRLPSTTPDIHARTPSPFLPLRPLDSASEPVPTPPPPPVSDMLKKMVSISPSPAMPPAAATTTTTNSTSANTSLQVSASPSRPAPAVRKVTNISAPAGRSASPMIPPRERKVSSSTPMGGVSSPLTAHIVLSKSAPKPAAAATASSASPVGKPVAASASPKSAPAAAAPSPPLAAPAARERKESVSPRPAPQASPLLQVSSSSPRTHHVNPAIKSSSESSPPRPQEKLTDNWSNKGKNWVPPMNTHEGPEYLPSDAPNVVVPARKYAYDTKTCTWKEVETMIRVLHPNRGVSQGAMRVCFVVDELDESGFSTPMVAKMFRHNLEGIVESDYFNEGEAQCICGIFAEKFNRVEVPKKLDRFIVSFLQCDTVRIRPRDIPVEYQSRRSGFFSYRPTDSQDIVFTMEPRLKGNFTKYTSNYGDVYEGFERRLDSATEKKRHRILKAVEAFSHFTLIDSGGSMLVCDLQGVHDFLTDPQIHTEDGKGLGMGNMGQKGIDKWVQRHRCNKMCRALGLPELSGPMRSATSGTAVDTRISYYKILRDNLRTQAPSAPEDLIPLPKPLAEMTDEERFEYAIKLSQLTS